MPNPRKILLVTPDESQKECFLQLKTGKNNTLSEITHLDHISKLRKDIIMQPHDVAIIDLSSPDTLEENFEAIRYIHECNKMLSIIVLMEEEDDRLIIRAVGNGVQDYLIKGVSSDEIIRRAIRYAVQRKRYEEKIAYLTMQDHLTGLMNTELIPSALKQAINSAKREKAMLAVYYVDIDNFKLVNDMHGRDIGNALLIEVASRLQKTMDDNSILARMNADTFVVIDIAEDLDACAVLAEEMMSVMCDDFFISNQNIPISATIGVATYPECGTRHHELMRHADMALRQAKEQERGSYKFFSSELNEQVMQRIHITSALKESINGDEFNLFYQPKINLHDMSVCGVEGLIRWNNKKHGNIRPDQFIPLAEESGLVHHISEWVMRRACSDHSDALLKDLNMSINVSAKELSSEDTISLAKNVLLETDMNPEKLVIEITETAMMVDTRTAMKVMKELRELGIKLHIDDFGIGYSSIDYLRRFPIDALKVDRSFVMNMHEKPDDLRMVRLMIDIAHELEMEVIAEGVENAEQQHLLHGMNCDIAQGYYFARPMPLEELRIWYENYNQQEQRIVACSAV